MKVIEGVVYYHIVVVHVYVYVYVLLNLNLTATLTLNWTVMISNRVFVLFVVVMVDDIDTMMNYFDGVSY